MQNLKANWLMAWKMTWSISSIFMRAVESLKIYTLIRSFCKKHIKFTPKSTEDLSLMTLKSDAKFEEKLALGSKNDMMNLANFNASNGKSCTVMCYFFHINFQLRKCRRVISHDIEECSKLWRKNHFLFKKWYENFGEF